MNTVSVCVLVGCSCFLKLRGTLHIHESTWPPSGLSFVIHEAFHQGKGGTWGMEMYWAGQVKAHNG